MFGELTLSALPLDQPIPVISGGVAFAAFAWRDDDEYLIPAGEVERVDRADIEERRGLVTIAGGA